MMKLLIIFSFMISFNLFAKTKLTFVYEDVSPPYSYLNDKKEIIGMFPKIVDLIFLNLPEYEVVHQSMPWSRAQLAVENREADGFLTYPSDKRKKYADFSKSDVFVEDIGYLVYATSNLRKEVIINATSFESLKNLTFLGSDSSDWEVENFPKNIKKLSVPDDSKRILMLTKRAEGDFLVMGLEQLKYLAEKEDVLNNIKVKKVSFIKDSKVNFHLGISKKNPDSSKIISKINKVIQDKKFQSELKNLIKSYQI